MIQHIILWKIKEEFSSEEKAVIRENAKLELEGLLGRIEGLEKVWVETRRLASSNADMMLYTEFSDREALEGYQRHPLHNAVADAFVRPFVCQRLCLDVPA
ncbi:MAG: Dabb family protein [Clostridia bacterium]|nr:Dabb family protein [Clostridia bacterium]